MQEEPTTSNANLALGGILAAAALYSVLALLSTGLGAGAPAFLAGPGAAMRGAFSWASLFVPAWLAAAALLAFLPGFRPGALVALAGSVLPFLPIAAFARLTEDTQAAFEAYPFLEAAGSGAIGVAAGALALALIALVARFALAAGAAAPRVRERGPRPGLLLGPPVEGESEEETGEATVAGRPVPADAPFSFVVPELAPLPPLRALDQDPSAPTTTAPDRLDSIEAEEDDEAAIELLETVDEAEPLLDEVEEGADEIAPESIEPSEAAAAPPPEPAPAPVAAPVAIDPPMPAPGSVPAPVPAPAPVVEPAPAPVPVAALELAAAPVSPPKAAAERPQLDVAGVLELAGSPPIEFTSVPPAPAAEAEKEAAIKRILARKKDKPYAVPADGILNAYPDGQYWIIDDKTKRSAEVLRDTLAEFSIEAEVTGIRKGPVITMFEILPAPGVKLSKITNLADNIALRLAASSVRIVAPIPGKHAVGIEVPNERRSIVSLREIVENEAFKTAKMEVPVILGKDIAGEAQYIDLVQTPHLLIAGATGSGKSVCVNSIILSVLFRRSPEEVKLLLIDPKIVELKLYNDIPHLLTPVITEPKRAFQALQYCICEMERRYSMLDRVGVRDIKSYNRKVKDKALAQERLPYIVVIIDEFADLMATTGKELESTLARLAAMSRAVGIHLVLATQRPSIDVITGLIKANIPSRIAFMVAGKFDSRIIIDSVGAEKLLGKGDMLFASAWDPFPIRMQGAFVSDEEVEKAVEFVKTLGEPDYIDEEIFIDDEEEEGESSLFSDEDDDPLYEKALEIVLQQGKASASYIQRRLKIGYNRASRLVELMEEKGIVGPAKGSKPRDIVRNPEVLGRAPASPNARFAEGQRQPSLLPGLETVPGQRVTGRDEDARDEVANGEVARDDVANGED